MIIDAKTAVANARCIVVISGSSDVTTTSPPTRLWTMRRIIASAIALDGPEGRGFILHTSTVLISRRIPVTMVSIL
jgi:hypothetical protein